MAITQIIATLPAVLNDSETFYEDIAVRNNSLVTTVLPSINAWATQANTTQAEINAKALQVASQAVDGGYSQNYINTNFVGVNNAQNITAIKTFTVSPIVPNATTSLQPMAYGQGVNLTAAQTIAGVKTFSSNPISSAAQSTLTNALTRKDYVDGKTGAASETVSGIIELATTAEAQAGTDDLRAITPLKLRNALNASGTAPIYACRAWVNFNGTGTVAIRESGNVSSITDDGVGMYTMNFATAMPDANYSMGGISRQDLNTGSIGIVAIRYQTVLTPSSFKVETGNDSGTKYDMTYVTLQVCR